MSLRSPWHIFQRNFTATCLQSSNTLSTLHRGTAFEERSLKILQDNLSMTLRRVGGKEDGGIDLMGWWWLPTLDDSPARRRFRVLGQCKAEKKRMGPNYVRELEGVLHRFIAMPNVGPSAHPEPPNPNTPIDVSFAHSELPLVALLISESAFTKSTILRVMSSPIPFFLLHIPPLADSDVLPNGDRDFDHLGSAVWNPALGSAHGLLGGAMEVRWERSAIGIGRPGLWWQGKKLHNYTPTGISDHCTKEPDNVTVN